MAYWLLESDPDDYGFEDLERDGSTVWDGVKNNLALSHLRKVRKGDGVLVYHSGKEKAVVGLAEAASDAYAGSKDGKLVVFDLAAVRRLKKPVTLAAIKADKSFAQFALVRMSRLSVMPVDAGQWKRILGMAG